MQSWRFFSRPFNENFKFLKICPYDFHKFYTVIIRPKVLLCAQWHQNRMTEIWETTKISSKTTKNSHFCTLFIFLKLSIRFERNTTNWKNFYGVFLHHLRAWLNMCNFIKIVWTAIRASPKEKGLSGLLYRTCGSGLLSIRTNFALLNNPSQMFDIDGTHWLHNSRGRTRFEAKITSRGPLATKRTFWKDNQVGKKAVSSYNY